MGHFDYASFNKEVDKFKFTVFYYVLAVFIAVIGGLYLAGDPQIVPLIDSFFLFIKKINFKSFFSYNGYVYTFILISIIYLSGMMAASLKLYGLSWTKQYGGIDPPFIYLLPSWIVFVMCLFPNGKKFLLRKVYNFSK